MSRPLSEHPLKTAALLLLGLLTVATSATARHRHSSDAVPGTFDYYLLSLSWSPAFCLSEPGAAECTGPRRFGFIVHGLWPQYEEGWPENCNVHEQVPDSVVSGISGIMPARGLIYHEWSAHGTCSGLDPQRFLCVGAQRLWHHCHSGDFLRERSTSRTNACGHHGSICARQPSAHGIVHHRSL